MGVIGPSWACPYCGCHYKYKSSAILCYETVCFTNPATDEVEE